MKNKKMLFIALIAIIIVVVIVVVIILNKNKNKENDIDNNIDTDIDQNLFVEEELDQEEIEALNRQRTQEIRNLKNNLKFCRLCLQNLTKVV